MIFNIGGPLDQIPTVTRTGSNSFKDEGSGQWNAVFTGSGTLKVDVDCEIDIFAVGGGGGGGGVRSGAKSGGGGGGGGLVFTRRGVHLTAGKTYTVTVGAGGSGGNGANGSKGGTSSFKDGGTVILSVEGGYGGKATNYGNPGAGGDGFSSGGGGAKSGSGASAGKGGSNHGLGGEGNGGAGYIINIYNTDYGPSPINAYAFGDSGWAYPAAGRKFAAGGGGGGRTWQGGQVSGGSGGAYGGGDGKKGAGNGGAATANSGSGGGGAAGNANSSTYTGGKGGSGIVIVRSAR